MTLLICYKNYYGAHVFFLPGAQSMLKPALDIRCTPYTIYSVYNVCRTMSYNVVQYRTSYVYIIMWYVIAMYVQPVRCTNTRVHTYTRTHTPKCYASMRNLITRFINNVQQHYRGRTLCDRYSAWFNVIDVRHSFS